MKTWYEGHDRAYRKRKADGWTGWSERREEVEETVSVLERVILADYVPKKGRFLELGCGAGDFTLWAAGKGYEAYGVDISPAAVDWAREKAEKNNLKIDFRTGNVLNLEGYSDDFFDFILDGHCLHCIIGEDRKLFLSSAFRVLKRGGFFHIGTMCNEPGFDDGSFDTHSRCTVYGDIASRYIGLPEDILQEIREGGFRILHSEIIKSNSNGIVQEGLLVECRKD